MGTAAVTLKIVQIVFKDIVVGRVHYLVRQLLPVVDVPVVSIFRYKGSMLLDRIQGEVLFRLFRVSFKRLGH